MRWLIVTEDLPPTRTGGVASWVDDLAVALVAAGHEVVVAARRGRGAARGPERAWDLQRPFKVVRMWGRSWARWGATWAWWQAGNRLSRVDRVVFATWPLAVRLSPEARRRGVPAAVAFHGSDLTRLPAPPADFTRAVGAAAARLPVSAFLGRELERLGQRADAVLPMPLALGAPPAPGPREGLLVVARLTGLKGADRAIALARALDQPLHVVGDGPALPQLRAAAEGARVTFHGRLPRPTIRQLYARCAATLLLSRADADGTGAEGLGLTLLEAQARGCPVVGVRTGGIPEAVGPGVVLDDPDGLPAADLDRVRGLLADPGAGAAARSWVTAHHGPERAVAVLAAALDRPLAGSDR